MDESSSSIHQEESYSSLPALSDTQDYVLSIVPIPAALLSIVGSLCIIRMNFTKSRRKKKKLTPYNRLLIAMSVCDIMYSIMLATSIFLMPSDSSSRLLAMGNDTTCTITGFVMQFSNSTIIYNTMLSFYFLCIARFGISNAVIARRIEPFMHFLAIGYPLITGIVGLVMGVYSEPELSNACWVNNYPKNCGTIQLDGPGASGETCQSPKIAWAFAGIWYIVALVSLVANNVVICIHVWRQTRPRKPSRTTIETNKELGMDEDSDELESSSLHDHDDNYKKSIDGGTSVAQLEIDESRRNPAVDNTQLARLKLVRSQALFFVGSYMLCMLWTVTLRLVEAYAGSYEEKLAANNYTLLVLQAWFLPLQGFLNMFVYIRPKFLRRRQQKPNERLLDSLIFSVLGEKSLGQEEGALDVANANRIPAEPQQVQSTSNHNHNHNHNKTKQAKGHYFQRLKRSFISSITASQGDFIENIDEEHRWGTPLQQQEATIDAPRRLSSKKEDGSSSFEVSRRSSSNWGTGGSSLFNMSSGDITKSVGTSRRNSTGNGSSLFNMSSGDITRSNGTSRRNSTGNASTMSYRTVRRSSSNSFSAATISPTPPPTDRMLSVSQQLQQDAPLKFPHRQESKHQRDAMESPLATTNDNRRGRNHAEDSLQSPRRSVSGKLVVCTMEDLPAIDEVGEHHHHKSWASRTSNDTVLNSTSNHSNNNDKIINRWQLPVPPLETSSGLEKPIRQLSDDDDDLLNDFEDEEIVDENESSEIMVSSQRSNTIQRSTSITMTGIISIVPTELEPSESSEMWSGELKLPDEPASPKRQRPKFDQLAISEHSLASAQSMGTSKSWDVALQVPTRQTSEADEMEDSSHG